MTTYNHEVAVNLCAYRDGGIYCRHCGRKVGDATTAKEQAQGQPPFLEKLQVDHINGDPDHNPPDGSNWQLLCMTCNLKKGDRPAGIAAGPREKRLEEIRRQQRHGKEALQDATRDVKQRVDYSSGETSMQVNGICQARFTDWVMNKIKHDGVIAEKEAIASGAYVAGCNVLTAKRYLEPLTSRMGPLMRIKSIDGEVLLTIRPETER